MKQSKCFLSLVVVALWSFACGSGGSNDAQEDKKMREDLQEETARRQKLEEEIARVKDEQKRQSQVNADQDLKISVDSKRLETQFHSAYSLLTARADEYSAATIKVELKLKDLETLLRLETNRFDQLVTESQEDLKKLTDNLRVMRDELTADIKKVDGNLVAGLGAAEARLTTAYKNSLTSMRTDLDGKLAEYEKRILAAEQKLGLKRVPVEAERPSPQ